MIKTFYSDPFNIFSGTFEVVDTEKYDLVLKKEYVKKKIEQLKQSKEGHYKAIASIESEIKEYEDKLKD